MSYVDYNCKMEPAVDVVLKLDIDSDGARACLKSLFIKSTTNSASATGNIMLDFIRDGYEFLKCYSTIAGALDSLTSQEKDFIVDMRSVIGKPHIDAHSPDFPQQWFNLLVASEAKCIINAAQDLRGVKVTGLYLETQAATRANSFLNSILTPPSSSKTWTVRDD